MAIVWALVAWLATGDCPSAVVRATVWVRVGDRANGTGWVVDTDRKWIVTAAHVVGDHGSAEICFLDRCLGHSIFDRRHYMANRRDLARRGLAVPARVIRRHVNADLMLLEVDRIPAGIPALPLATEFTSQGEPCSSVGHRHDADLMWNRTAGAVRQVGRLAAGYFTAGHRIGAGMPLLLLQSPIEAGESGSAVVNRSGRVIGMVSAIANQVPGLAIAVDVSEIRLLLPDAPKHAIVVPRRSPPPAAEALPRATVWVSPQSTAGRAAGVLIDFERRLVLTSATAVGTEPLVDVVAPRWFGGRIVPETDVYVDRLGLRLTGDCVAGIVLARDPIRDVALIELDAVPENLSALSLATTGTQMGDRVASMGHPSGIDLQWLYAAGTVRSIGSVNLAREAGEGNKVRAALLQLPHQGGSSGGPVVNEAGQLVGILASREAARQDLAYTATIEEVRSFLLDSKPLWAPTSGVEWARRGRLALKLHRTAAASEGLRRAAQMDPNDPAIAAACAAALQFTGDNFDAIRVAEVGVRNNPCAATLAELAETFVKSGRPARAGELIDRALKLDPHCSEALVARASLRSGPEALQDVAEALAIDPTLTSAFRIRAVLNDLATPEGRRAGIADWNRVLERLPTDTDALRYRAALFGAINEAKKAAADWSRLTELQAFRAENWVNLARAQFASGDRQGAAESLRSALRVDPQSAAKVFEVVGYLGRELLNDNPADQERVASWRSTALERLALWIFN
jgi:S1-C subfamily serine protease